MSEINTADFTSNNYSQGVDYEKQVYDLKQLLEISRSLCTTFELEKLIESILYITMAQMRVLGAGIFTRQSLDQKNYELGKNYTGFEVSLDSDFFINCGGNLAKFLQESDTCYTIEDLEKLVGSDDCDLKILKKLKPTLIVPLNLKKRLVGIMVLGERICIDGRNCAYSNYEREEVIMLSSLSAVAISNAFLLEQSATDMMTHLKLRHYFFNILSDRMDLAKVHGESICVLMIDIDHFKNFNDQYGHACGDYVLQQVASMIKESIRPSDIASRYGGEEFTVMLSDTQMSCALKVAKRILDNICEDEIIYEDKKLHVTVSIGVAAFDPASSNVLTASDLVKLADQAMYISKKNGRNKISYLQTP